MVLEEACPCTPSATPRETVDRRARKDIDRHHSTYGVVLSNHHSPTNPVPSFSRGGILIPCKPVYFGLSGVLHPSKALASVILYTSTPRGRVVDPISSLLSHPQFERSPITTFVRLFFIRNRNSGTTYLLDKRKVHRELQLLRRTRSTHQVLPAKLP